MICRGCKPVHCGRAAPMEATEGTDRWAPVNTCTHTHTHTHTHTVRTLLHAADNASFPYFCSKPVIRTKFVYDSCKNTVKPRLKWKFIFIAKHRSPEYKQNTDTKLHPINGKKSRTWNGTEGASIRIVSVHVILFKIAFDGIYLRIHIYIPNKKEAWQEMEHVQNSLMG
jgi:hypothetical protein